MEIRRLLRYSEPELAGDTWPQVADVFGSLRWMLASHLDGEPQLIQPKSLLCVVGFFPDRSRTQRPQSLEFLVFSRARSTYAALRDLEDVFGELYLRTDILPIITPAPQRMLTHPDRLPKHYLMEMAKRGGLVHEARR